MSGLVCELVIWFSSLISSSTAWAMGSIMAAVAVLLIHIDRKAVVPINPNSSLERECKKLHGRYCRINTMRSVSYFVPNTTIDGCKVLNRGNFVHVHVILCGAIPPYLCVSATQRKCL